jgi:drug/metabolite transporter (DMT)-like permease
MEPAVAAPAAFPARPGFTGTDAMLAGMVLVWGANFIVIKAALAVMEPIAFNALRFAIASVSVTAVALLSGAPRPTRADLPRLTAMGVLGTTVYQFAFIEGLAHTRAGNAALIMAAVPVQTAVASHVRGHERLRLRDGLGLLLSSAGIVTIVLGSAKAVSFGSTIHGDLLVLLSTVCWTAYTIGTKPMADRLGPTAATAWTLGLGSLPLLLVSVPWVVAQDWAVATPGVWAAVLYSSLGSLVIAYLIWYRGVQRLGPTRTALYSNFTPVVAMLAAWALLRETPTAWQIVGAAGIFAGLYLART